MQKFPSQEVPEFQVFKKLGTPQKVQDFLNTIPMNFEVADDTCYSPLVVLRKNTAQCIEGALLAAAIFWYHGEKPLLLDLKTTDADDGHVVTLFKQSGLWGAVSKTNHGVLRYRDPVYKTVRELSMSYFNEYFLDGGEKTMRSFSKPFSLLSYEDNWLTNEENLFAIVRDLDASPHEEVSPRKILKNLRPADKIEIKAGKLHEWKPPRGFREKARY